jgi:hypothetical protein
MNRSRLTPIFFAQTRGPPRRRAPPKRTFVKYNSCVSAARGPTIHFSDLCRRWRIEARSKKGEDVMARRFILALAAIAMSCVAFGSYAAEPHKQQVRSYVLPAAPVTSPVPGTTLIHLAIGLPPKDAAGLRAFAEAVADPKSSQFRKFLTLEQLTERFGPSAADYQALIAWAQANKLTVETQYPHRLLLGIRGTAADVE